MKGFPLMCSRELSEVATRFVSEMRALTHQARGCRQGHCLSSALCLSQAAAQVSCHQPEEYFWGMFSIVMSFKTESYGSVFQ